jgi:hypothetical protein
MPLRYYSPRKKPCRLCGDGFDHQQPADSSPLPNCPTCGQEVDCQVSPRVNSPQLSAPVSVSRAKQAGFTVLKRIASGEYERQ